MDPIPDQDQEENIENITDPELERIEGENIYLMVKVKRNHCRNFASLRTH